MAEGPFSHLAQTLRGAAPAIEPPTPANVSLLPPVFQFSQNSLQDYADCARRFQLRYVLGQRWPAAVSEPIGEYEEHTERGAHFHTMVRRYYLGLLDDPAPPEDAVLRQWWQAFIETPPEGLPESIRLPEMEFSVPLAGQRLLARFDLLTIDPGERIVIVDWKTTQHRTARHILERRLQTLVYRYVATKAAGHLFGGTIAPEQVSMVYWFAIDPLNTEVFTYSEYEHEQARQELNGIIREIEQRGQAEPTSPWPLTEDEARCRFCEYRSLCRRDVPPGSVGESLIEGDSGGFDFDLDEIDEIAF